LENNEIQLLVSCLGLVGVIVTAIMSYRTNKNVKNSLDKNLSKLEFVNGTRNACSNYFGLCFEYLYFLKLNIPAIKKNNIFLIADNKTYSDERNKKFLAIQKYYPVLLMRLGKTDKENNIQIRNFQDRLNLLNEQVVNRNNKSYINNLICEIDKIINDLSFKVIPYFENLVSEDWKHIQVSKKNDSIDSGTSKRKKLVMNDDLLEKGFKLLLEQLTLYAITIFTLFSEYGSKNPNRVINYILIVILMLVNVVYLIFAFTNMKKKYTNSEDIDIKNYIPSWLKIGRFMSIIVVITLIFLYIVIPSPSPSAIIDYFIKLLMPLLFIIEIALLTFYPQFLMKKINK
jgi:uncharacterized membrane protein YidH (DUF202 family)